MLTDNGAGHLPEVAWEATGHTATLVPIYAWGPGSERVSGTMDNTDIFYLVTGTEKQP